MVLSCGCDLFLALSFICVAFWVLFLNPANRRRHALANEFPGPKTLPILGNILSFINRNADDVMKMVRHYHVKFGEIYRIKAFDVITFMVTDPKVIEIVLSNSTKHLAKSRLYALLASWLGDGLLLSSGKKWFNRRKVLTPAFHFSILEQFVEVFDRQSRILVECLSDHCTGKVVDINPFITLMALDIVCETAMGVKINAQTNPNNEYVKAVHNIAKLISTRVAKVWQRIDLLFATIAFQQKRKYDICIKTLHEFTESVIEQRREEMKHDKKNENDSNNLHESDVGIKTKMALLDILLKSTVDGKPLTNSEIREEVDTFMFEGHDTTTAGIIFTLYLLSRHKSVQDKLFKEIIDIIGYDCNAPVNYRQLSSLKYMEAVIKESLRLYPPVPIIGRRLDADVLLDDGRILPANTNFNLMLYVMFKSPKYFTDPEKFDPDRFIGENDDNERMNPYTFIPFSAGSRNCIGQKFAVLEMKSTISKILRYYELLPMGDAPITLIELVLRSKNGIQMGLSHRNYS